MWPSTTSVGILNGPEDCGAAKVEAVDILASCHYMLAEAPGDRDVIPATIIHDLGNDELDRPSCARSRAESAWMELMWYDGCEMVLLV